MCTRVSRKLLGYRRDTRMDFPEAYTHRRVDKAIARPSAISIAALAVSRRMYHATIAKRAARSADSRARRFIIASLVRISRAPRSFDPSFATLKFNRGSGSPARTD